MGWEATAVSRSTTPKVGVELTAYVNSRLSSPEQSPTKSLESTDPSKFLLQRLVETEEFLTKKDFSLVDRCTIIALLDPFLKDLFRGRIQVIHDMARGCLDIPPPEFGFLQRVVIQTWYREIGETLKKTDAEYDRAIENLRKTSSLEPFDKAYLFYIFAKTLLHFERTELASCCISIGIELEQDSFKIPFQELQDELKDEPPEKRSKSV